MTPTSIVAYLVLFATVGFLFVFAALLVGWFLRAKIPTPEKLATYDCGEPSIGSSFGRFDLRFYVVALLFVVLEVEVAFLFPWAVVFGKMNHLRDPGLPRICQIESNDGRSGAGGGQGALSAEVAGRLRELGVAEPGLPLPGAGCEENEQRMLAVFDKLAVTAMIDVAVFVVVILVGFAYLWQRGDLDWVRALPTAAGMPEDGDQHG